MTKQIISRYTLAAMEENQNQNQVPQGEAPKVEAVTQPETVSFPPIPVRTGKPKRTKTFLGIFILIIFIVGGFLIFKDGKKGEDGEPTATPVVIGSETVAPTPTASTKPVDKTEVSVEIQNGTGTTGGAAYLKTLLTGLGYSDFKVGNASSTSNVTTTVTFASALEIAVKDEIVAKLKEVYKEVDDRDSTTQKTDVVIVTGLRKTETAKPTATATPKATGTGTATPTATATVTATPTSIP